MDTWSTNSENENFIIKGKSFELTPAAQVTNIKRCGVSYKGREKTIFWSGYGTYPFFFHSQIDQFFKDTSHFDLLWIIGRKPTKPKEKESQFNLSNHTEVSQILHTRFTTAWSKSSHDKQSFNLNHNLALSGKSIGSFYQSDGNQAKLLHTYIPGTLTLFFLGFTE